MAKTAVHDVTTVAEIIFVDDTGKEVRRTEVCVGSTFEANWLNIGEWPDVLITRNDLANPQLKVSLCGNFITWCYDHDDNSGNHPVAYYHLKSFAYLNV